MSNFFISAGIITIWILLIIGLGKLLKKNNWYDKL
jgi:hypothetical protein